MEAGDLTALRILKSRILTVRNTTSRNFNVYYEQSFKSLNWSQTQFFFIETGAFQQLWRTNFAILKKEILSFPYLRYCDTLIVWNNKNGLLRLKPISSGHLLSLKLGFSFFFSTLIYTQRVKFRVFFLNLLSWIALGFKSKVAFGDMRVVG